MVAARTDMARDSRRFLIERRKLMKGLVALPAISVITRLPGRSVFLQPSLQHCLADQINATLDAVQDWSSLVDIGTVMNRSSNSDYDPWITSAAENNDWNSVFMIKSHAQHSGYHSSTIDECVEQALSNASMFQKCSIPITEDDYQGQWFWPFCKYMLYPYRYARELDWETEKWDPSRAFNYLSQVYDSFGTAFYRLNDTLNPSNPTWSNYAQTTPYGTRWLEFGKLMGCFLFFYDMGISSALQYAQRCWLQLNSSLWRQTHYTYSPNWYGYEFSSMDVFVDSLKLRSRLEQEKYSEPLLNSDRIFADMESRYLSGYGNGQWSTINGNTAIAQHLRWSNDGREIGQISGNSQLRLDGTLNAWILLHMIYNELSVQGKSTMTAMLEGNGTVQAWSGLIQSNLSRNWAFLPTSTDVNTSDSATAMASVCLFLNGISVHEGEGLVIPLCTDNENDHSAINSYHFGFNYFDHEIKIPAWAGTTLNFMFGTIPSQLSFSDTGVYTVNFSDDWNRITNSQLVCGLNSSESYVGDRPTKLTGPQPQ